MNLAEYESAKFELAAVIRSAVIASGRAMSDAPDGVRDLFSRLADDRFNLAVVGRFNRGKTSLMNAVLGTTRLPTGIVPLTSVITAVSYGSHEEVFIEFEGNRLPFRIPLERLSEYVTQECNPGNDKRVAVASVRLPCELLRRGFYFVDTPGIGSSIRENTFTTERFLPDADAFVLVSSYDSPLSDEETALLRHIVPTGKRLFFVLNKQDIVSAEDGRRVRDYVRTRLRELFGPLAPSMYSVSALDALKADADGLTRADNGVAQLRDRLVAFLIAEKQSRFLVNMVDRMATVIYPLPNSSAAIARLNELRRHLQKHPDDGIETVSRPFSDERRISTCTICGQIEHQVFSFLSKFQYDIAFDERVRADLAERGGLCALHTWQYHGLASPLGASIGFSLVLDRMAARLRSVTDPLAPHIEKLRVAEDRCPVCQVRAQAERRAVVDVAASFRMHVETPSMPTVCLAHVGLIIDELKDAVIARRLLAHEAELYERLSEDMRRYALKLDGVRRDLTSEGEQVAATLALSLLAGNYSVNAARKAG